MVDCPGLRAGSRSVITTPRKRHSSSDIRAELLWLSAGLAIGGEWCQWCSVHSAREGSTDDSEVAHVFGVGAVHVAV